MAIDTAIPEPPQLLLKGKYNYIKSIFGIINNPDEYKKGYVQKCGLCGSIYHKGGPANIGEAYAKLLEYLDERGYKVVGDSIEMRRIDEL